MPAYMLHRQDDESKDRKKDKERRSIHEEGLLSIETLWKRNQA